jgi:AraC-like DNA-binding protein
MHNLPEQQKYDPWEAKQEIANLKIEIHCSRYWLLSEWECENLSLPFWRVYHSKLGGSFVRFKGSEIELTSNILVLIPPYTAFSSRIHTYNVKTESIKGVKITSELQIEHYKKSGLVDQFFVHFNLGYPYDKMTQDIYVCELNEYWGNELRKIEIERLSNPNSINFYGSMQLNSLLLYALQLLLPKMWNMTIPDKRIAKVLSYIDENIGTELLNSQLSGVASMATNSFARLFKSVMQMTVQQHIQQKRIEKAIMLFHHSSLEIDEIAGDCGFYDRHHFSNVFKKQTGYPPAKYRQKIV